MKRGPGGPQRKETQMQRIIGPILGLLGILLIIGLVAGIAYSAGLAAAGVVVAPGAVTTVVPAVGYGWYGGPFFGFGQFLFFLFGILLFIGLLRFAFGWGRRGRGYGWGPGWGGYGRGPGGWDHDHGAAGGSRSGDPREAWIRARLDEWHQTAHAGGGGTAGTGQTAANGPAATTDPADPPNAG
jgi:hypothetical protein